MFSRAVDILLLAAAAAMVLALTLASRGAATTPPATQPAADDVEIVLLSRDCVWAVPRALPLVRREYPGCVLVVVRCEYPGESEECEYAACLPDRDGPASACEIRAVAERCYPGRRVVLLLVVPDVPEGPPPEAL